LSLKAQRQPKYSDIFSFFSNFTDDKEESHYIEFANLNSKYILFKYKPELEFSQFLVNFGGLLGLWHGISLIELKSIIMNFINKNIFVYIRVRKLWTYFAVLKLFKKFFKCFKIEVH
jgi:hypothetical protein